MGIGIATCNSNLPKQNPSFPLFKTHAFLLYMNETTISQGQKPKGLPSHCLFLSSPTSNPSADPFTFTPQTDLGSIFSSLSLLPQP